MGESSEVLQKPKMYSKYRIDIHYNMNKEKWYNVILLMFHKHSKGIICNETNRDQVIKISL